MLAISALGWVGAVGREMDIGLWLVVLDICLGVAASVAVFWRPRWPMGVALVLGRISTVSISSSGPGVLAVASLATRRRIGEIAPVAAVTIACWVLFELITDNTSPLWQVSAFSVVMILAAVGCGIYVGSRREHAALPGHSRPRRSATQAHAWHAAADLPSCVPTRISQRPKVRPRRTACIREETGLERP